MDVSRQIRGTGRICLVAAALLFAPALYLHCVAFALGAGLKTALLGGLAGLSLAGATRTLRVALIYLGLFAAVCATWGLISVLDAASAESFLIPKGASSIWESYPVFLRIGAFFLAAPYPFARLGYHAPDVFSDTDAPSGETE